MTTTTLPRRPVAPDPKVRRLEDDLRTLRRTTLAAQADLWGDLDAGVRRAYNGAWSMECDALTRRLVVSVDVVGACRWEQCPTSLLRGGVVTALLDAAGAVRDPEPDGEYWRAHDAGQVGTEPDLDAWLTMVTAQYATTRDQVVAAVAEHRHDFPFRGAAPRLCDGCGSELARTSGCCARCEAGVVGGE